MSLGESIHLFIHHIKMKTKTHRRESHQLPQILLITITLWLLLNVSLTRSISKHPILIIVSFDGFRYDYLYKTYTPHFQALIANGVHAEWIEPRFVTKTFPNHHSIATGLYEESHGIVANNFYDPVLNDTFNMDDTGAEWWDTGAIPLYTWNQMQGSDRYSGGMMWPGTNALIKNQTAHVFKAYKKNVPWVDRVDEVIQWLMDESTPVNCVFLYFENPDGAGHKYGPDSWQVVAEIQRADNITGYLVSKLKEVNLFDSVNLIITSDHGMTSVPSTHAIDMTKFSNVETYQAYGGSPVWTIQPDPGYDDVLYESLLNASQYHNFKVYKKEDIPEVYHYKHNRRILPILVVANDHWDIFPYDGQEVNPMTGNHGYNNSYYEMRPFFLAHGPSLKNGYVSGPFKNIDIFPLASCLIGLPPPPNNGSLENVQSLLKDSQICQQLVAQHNSSSTAQTTEV